MTVEIALLVGDGPWHTHDDPATGTRAVRMSDGPTGLRVEQDGQTLAATCFPTAGTLAAAWDPALVAEVGAALGAEAASLGVDVLLAPGVNIKRNPLCGRNFEYFSEDPHLAGELGVAYVTGVQRAGVGACVKHFAANNQERQRLFVSAEVDARTLREIYLRAFEEVVTRARPWTLMCAYNRLGGVHCSEHRWLLTELLRDEWGFDGLVVSDWGAVHDPVASVRAGLDLQMPGDDGTAERALAEALASGVLPPDAVALAAGRIRALAKRCGPPRVAVPLPAERLAAHDELARRAASTSTVLLTNDGTLPLVGVRRLALIGRQAAEPVIQGGGSSTVNPRLVTTLLGELPERLPDARIAYEPGYDYERVEFETRFGVDPHSAAALALREAAVAAARDADVVVACVGHPMWVECEGYDRRDLDLPPDQAALLEALVATGVPVVVAVFAGAPVVLGDWADRAAAVLLPGFGGQHGGAALADVLVGVAEPGGRLAETWPVRLADAPLQATFPGERAQVRYGEGVFVGYRWYDALDLPVRFCFGHGLGYGAPVCTGASVEIVDAAAARVRVRASVRNEGVRAGSAVVQVYVGEQEPAVRRPGRELRAFASVALEPGEQREVTFELDGRAFAFWDAVGSAWQRLAGRYTVAVGLSSRDLGHEVVIDLPQDADAPAFVDDETLGRRLQRQ